MIPNGLDLSRARFASADRERIRAEFGLGPQTYVIGVLGRIEANKRFDLVIRSAAPLLDENTKLLIVGKGADGELLERVAHECGVADHVLFAGERHDVGAMLSSLDLFVASSRQETFGLSVLEALANGIPALYTTCPALEGVKTERARQVPGEETGMRAFLAEEIAAGQRERETVPEIEELYGIEAVTARIDDLYERLAERRERGRHRGGGRHTARGAHPRHGAHRTGIQRAATQWEERSPGVHP